MLYGSQEHKLVVQGKRAVNVAQELDLSFRMTEHVIPVVKFIRRMKSEVWMPAKG